MASITLRRARSIYSIVVCRVVRRNAFRSYGRRLLVAACAVVFVLEPFCPRTIAAGLVGTDGFTAGSTILTPAPAISGRLFPNLLVRPVLLLPGNSLLVTVVDNGV
jgi:hypothetical protein